jgi:restriction system protein
VDEKGKNESKKDGGIDLLIKKDNIYGLIQCKNYAPTTKLSQKLLRMFYGDCNIFIEKYNLNKENTKFIFIISNKESLTRSANQYLNEYNNFKCEVIEYIPK